MSANCPHCERGELETRFIEETIRYGGQQLAVPGVEISVCAVCSEELVLPEQAKRNELAFADAKRRRDGLWTSSDILSWRSRHHLTQSQAAMLFGGGVNAFSKYERGEVIQSKSMDLLMRASKAVPGLLPFLMAEAGIESESGAVADWVGVSSEIGSRSTVGHLRLVTSRTASRVAENAQDYWHEEPDLLVSCG